MKRSVMVTTLSSASIDSFRSTLYASGRAEKTISAYVGDLQTFLQEVGESEISMEDFEDIAMNWLTANRRRLAPKTTGRRLTSLRVFAKWAGKPGILREYSAPTAAKSQPHPIPEGIEGVRRIIQIARNERQRALIALCGLCGLRVSEALAIEPRHFDLNEMMLEVRGKGDKTRYIPVSPEAWNVLALSVTRAMCQAEKVVGIKDRFARRVVTDLGVRAGLKRHISSHDLRATFATAVYDKTGDIRLVQELLGHSSVQTTQLYTGVLVAKMRDAVQL